MAFSLPVFLEPGCLIKARLLFPVMVRGFNEAPSVAERPFHRASVSKNVICFNSFMNMTNCQGGWHSQDIFEEYKAVCNPIECSMC